MNNQYLIILIFIVAISCKNQSNVVEKDKSDPDLLSTELIRDGESLTNDDQVLYGELTFENTRWNFGKITQGENVEHVFHFENTGSNPVIISNALGSCGCTVPTWPKEPILPGEKGEIKVKFSSGTKSGKQSKLVKITANTKPNISQLYVEGEILLK